MFSNYYCFMVDIIIIIIRRHREQGAPRARAPAINCARVPHLPMLLAYAYIITSS